MSPTLGEAQAFGRAELAESDSPDVDVQILLCFVLECSPVRLMTASEATLTEPQWQQYSALIQRRKQGEPVAHIIGSRGFWSLDLAVDASTLIPRPDTELLVSLVLSKLKPGMRIVDLGTGTGAIALSLAAERPDISVMATDLQAAALRLAERNRLSHDLKNVSLVQMAWLGGFQSQVFDLIVSNPPYIERTDPHLTRGDVRFEPLTALVSGEDGLDDIRQIVSQARRCLKPGGWLLLEHGYDQSERVQNLFRDAGFEQVTAHQDFGGQDRAVMGQLTEFSG
jgi:release factor glutamine methyltransferase